MPKNDKIVGTARLGGKAFQEGDEKELNALGEELGVDVSRAYGVDSTEPKKSKGARTGAEIRSRNLARRQERQEGKAAGKEAKQSEKDGSELLETPVAELEAALEGYDDVGQVKKLARRDKRVSAKAVYERKIAELKAAEEETESEEIEVEETESEEE